MPRKGKRESTTDEQDGPQTEAREPRQKAGIFTRIKAAVTTGFCETCQKPAIPDAKDLHECARCRSKPLPHVLRHQEKKLAEKAREDAAALAAKKKGKTKAA